jgi:hypothetical protein
MKTYCLIESLFRLYLFAILLFNINSITRIKSKSPKEWVPDMIVNTTDIQSGLIDPENFVNIKSQRNEILELIDQIRENKKMYVTLVYISSISKNYTLGNEKDIFKFVDELSALLVNRNRDTDFFTILILFSINDRQMRIRTGNEVRKIINDEKSLEFLNSLRPEL